MAFRSLQNRWFVRVNFDNGEVRWQCENVKEGRSGSAHVAAMLRYCADMIDYFDHRRSDLPVSPVDPDAAPVPGSQA